MSAAAKKHVLIMDDSLSGFMFAFGIRVEDMFKNSGQDFEVVVAEDPQRAKMQLELWASEGIKPDIVSVDFLYDRYNGPTELERLLDTLYKDRENLKPAKIFVHSKSGLNEYARSEHSYGLDAMKRMGGEYCNTMELVSVASKFGSDDDRSYIAPTTTTFRDYLRTTFGLDAGNITREEQERQKEKRDLDRKGNTLTIHDAYCAVEDEQLQPDEALRRIDTTQIRSNFKSRLLNQAAGGQSIDYHPIDFKKGSGGAVTGVAAFNAEEVRRYKAEGKKVILILENYTPSDAGLLREVDGVVLLGRGSSHLPILCENFGIPGIFKQDKSHMAGIGSETPLSIEKENDTSVLVCKSKMKEESRRKLFDFTVRPGQSFSIESQTWSHSNERGQDVSETVGLLYRKPLEVQGKKTANSMTQAVMKWADDARRHEWHRKDNPACHGLKVKANADTPEQAKKAFEHGADGIGLVRTEHMLMGQDRLPALQTVLLAEDVAARDAALIKLKAAHKEDFLAIFKEAAAAEQRNHEAKTYLLPLPVTVRLLDTKPDELLPENAEGAAKAKIDKIIADNVRGAQFGLAHPEVYAMQAEAVFEAAKEAGMKAPPEIMIPMVKTADELAKIKTIVEDAAKKHGFEGKYKFGAMIETKEAVTNAAEIAKQCDFLSFGTNDLTAAIHGLPRGDIVAIDKWMREKGSNPYRTFSKHVKAAMEATVKFARGANKNIAISVCGDQVAGDKDSIALCQSLDLDGISVPGNLGSLATSRIIAGQEALFAYDKVREENKARKAAASTAAKNKPSTPGITPETLTRAMKCAREAIKTFCEGRAHEGEAAKLHLIGDPTALVGQLYMMLKDWVTSEEDKRYCQEEFGVNTIEEYIARDRDRALAVLTAIDEGMPLGNALESTQYLREKYTVVLEGYKAFVQNLGVTLPPPDQNHIRERIAQLPERHGMEGTPLAKEPQNLTKEKISQASQHARKEMERFHQEKFPHVKNVLGHLIGDAIAFMGDVAGTSSLWLEDEKARKFLQEMSGGAKTIEEYIGYRRDTALGVLKAIDEGMPLGGEPADTEMIKSKYLLFMHGLNIFLKEVGLTLPAPKEETMRKESADLEKRYGVQGISLVPMPEKIKEAITKGVEAIQRLRKERFGNTKDVADHLGGEPMAWTGMLRLEIEGWLKDDRMKKFMKERSGAYTLEEYLGSRRDGDLARQAAIEKMPGKPEDKEMKNAQSVLFMAAVEAIAEHLGLVLPEPNQARIEKEIEKRLSQRGIAPEVIDSRRNDAGAARRA